MTAREMMDIIRESALWNYLSMRQKKDALVYAVERLRSISPDNHEHDDVSDIVGEVFRS
jgi:hypothetical protein